MQIKPPRLIEGCILCSLEGIQQSMKMCRRKQRLVRRWTAAEELISRRSDKSYGGSLQLQGSWRKDNKMDVFFETSTSQRLHQLTRGFMMKLHFSLKGTSWGTTREPLRSKWLSLLTTIFRGGVLESVGWAHQKSFYFSSLLLCIIVLSLARTQGTPHTIQRIYKDCSCLKKCKNSYR